jgi:hypothetical protein
LQEALLWTLTPTEYRALCEIRSAHLQRQTDMFACLMTVLHRAHFQGSFEPSMFGASRPAQESVFGTQDVATKKAAFRSGLRAAWEARKKRLEVSNGR